MKFLIKLLTLRWKH